MDKPEYEFVNSDVNTLFKYLERGMEGIPESVLLGDLREYIEKLEECVASEGLSVKFSVDWTKYS